jgi:hypothetical protein
VTLSATFLGGNRTKILCLLVMWFLPFQGLAQQHNKPNPGESTFWQMAADLAGNLVEKAKPVVESAVSRVRNMSTSIGKISVAGVHLGMDINDAFDAICRKYQWQKLEADGDTVRAILAPDGSGAVLLFKKNTQADRVTEGPLGPNDEIMLVNYLNFLGFGGVPLSISRITANNEGKVAHVELAGGTVDILFQSVHLDAYQFANLFREANNLGTEGYSSGNTVMEHTSDNGTKVIIRNDKSVVMFPVPTRARMLEGF